MRQSIRPPPSARVQFPVLFLASRPSSLPWVPLQVPGELSALVGRAVRAPPVRGFEECFFLGRSVRVLCGDLSLHRVLNFQLLM